MHAVSGGERETVKLLLDAGADVNARDDRYHGTALMVAKIHTKVDGLSVQLELLGEEGAFDKDGLTELGRTKLKERVEKYTGIADLLKTYGTKE